MVGRTMKSRLPLTLVSIYKALCILTWKFCSPAWSPHYKKDGELLEKVQHRSTRMFSYLRKLSYSDCLKALGLWTVEERRNRSNIIQVFKMLKGFSKTPLETLFEWDTNRRTSGHSYKLKKRFSRSNTRHYYFSERVISRWNSLAGEQGHIY